MLPAISVCLDIGPIAANGCRGCETPALSTPGAHALGELSRVGAAPLGFLSGVILSSQNRADR
jgi:hypothetical protein